MSSDYDSSNRVSTLSYKLDPNYIRQGDRLVSTAPTSGSIGAINPLRYRGYYFDTETKLYYLQSRYYDPEVCRFINADEYTSTGQNFVGYNMFAYCLNNPVICADHSGNIPFLAVTAAIGAVAGAIVGGVAAAKKGENIWGGIGRGAACGALLGAGLGAAAGVVLAGSAVASTAAVATGASAFATTVNAAGCVAGAKMIADNVSQAIRPVAHVFWSGGDLAKNASVQVANNAGGTTLEMTRLGMYLERIGANRSAWSAASSNFANVANASNSAIYSIQNSEGVRIGSIWATVEYPILKASEIIYGVVQKSGSVQFVS